MGVGHRRCQCHPQDALNRRVAKEVNGTIVEKYLWEDLVTLLAVYDGNDRLVWRFEYAGGRMPVAMSDANRFALVAPHGDADV